MEARPRVHRGLLRRGGLAARRLPQGEPGRRGALPQHREARPQRRQRRARLGHADRLGGKVSLTYEDFAPPFNPFARATREMLEALAETRREGGLGVLLAHGLTATADYAYLFGRNRIKLTLI
jgi:hypothetical protein